MEAGQIRRLPVVDRGGKLVGMLSIGDLATRTEDSTKAGQTLQEISESG
jgi:CBS-domain-containing membrane protein